MACEMSEAVWKHVTLASPGSDPRQRGGEQTGKEEQLQPDVNHQE